jgi:hypothetical protein
MRRCLDETGSSTETEAKTKTALDRMESASGEAEWATTQTVHLAASLALEW